jgi:electron transfer flavoprotein beta subunit
VHTIVCIKQVPDTTEVRIDPATGTMVREGLKGTINPFDENAVEAALALREQHGGTVTALSMGIPSATEQLRHVLAMGADQAILLSDRALAGADTLATAYALSMAIRKIGDFDLVICGKQAIDGDTGQVGPGIAERLGIPQITYAREIEVGDGAVRVKRMLEDGYEIVEADLPALITVVKQINEPRYPSVRGLLSAKKKEIPIWSAQDIGADPDRIGSAGSPTRVIRTWTPSHQRRAEMLVGGDEAVDSLLERLQGIGVVPG